MAHQILTNDYSIYIGKDSLFELKAFLEINEFSSVFLLLDENTKKHCYPRLMKHVPFLEGKQVIEVKSGEHNKSLESCHFIWQELTDGGADRKSLLINLGGGVISDMGGFCAATFKRGMSFVNVATTLLSQVDASIGGKLAVDFNDFKNHIGLFGNPKAIYIDSTFLKTLEKRQLRSGYGEVLKHGLIQSSAYWDVVKEYNHLDGIVWEIIIHQSILIKKEIVEKDPFEHLERKALNFGHTIGHALESLSFRENKLENMVHGEAIAIGMISEAWLSTKYCKLTEEQLAEIAKVIIDLFGKYELNQLAIDEFFEIMGQDKKNYKENYNFSLLNAIGEFVINESCSKEDIIESLEYYKSL